MAVQIDCPGCGHRFEFSAENQAEAICPLCKTAIAKSAKEAAASGIGALELGPDESEPAPTAIRGVPPPPLPLRPVVLESISAPPRTDDEETRPEECPECGARLARSARRCRQCGARLGRRGREGAPPWERGFGPRRDTEPHRGSLILILGILSLVMMFLPMAGFPCGIAAWVMGQSDLRKMRNHDMDPEGMTSTQAGHVCGIIGTIMSGLMLLGCMATFLPAILDELP